MTYTFTLKPEFVVVIGEALANMPYKVSAAVLADLQKQISEQDADKRAKTEAA